MSDELRDIELVEITPDELEIFANIEAEELNIDVDVTETGPPGPPGDITQEVFDDTINALDGRVQANTDAIGALDGRVGVLESGIERSRIKQYGVRRQLGATSAELERLGDAVGLIANADNSLTTWNKVTNDFDHIYPWSHMRKCKINAGGTVVYDSYPTFGSFDGDWMIEIPEFYLKHTNDGTNMDYWISRYPLDDYEKVEKFYISQFKTTGGHTSLPNAAPLTSLSLDGFRNGAVAKGDGWRIIDTYANYIIRVLYQIEFAHLNSQLILGNGVTNVRYTEDDLCLLAETATNRAVVSDSAAANYEVGETVCIGSARGSSQGAKDRLITAINALEGGQTELVLDGDPFNTLTTYKVYSAAQHTGKTLQLTSSSGQSVGRTGRQSISYRGIEDWFGNVYDWTDGCLIEDHQAYVCLDPSKYSSTLTEDCFPLGYTNSTTSGYVLETGFDENFKHVQFSSTGGGGSTTGYCDHYYQSTGLMAAQFGGYFNNGSPAGAFFWSLNNAPSNAHITFGSRLLYKPA